MTEHAPDAAAIAVRRVAIDGLTRLGDWSLTPPVVEAAHGLLAVSCLFLGPEPDLLWRGITVSLTVDGEEVVPRGGSSSAGDGLVL